MNLVTTKPPVWIDTANSLLKAFDAMRSQPRIAVDTESNSLFAYQEKVCLIQISTPETDYIIDPLAVKDLALLGELFKNPDQEKIFHASEYDLLCLKRDYHFTFANIFDTMIAARVLGEPLVGLGSLLEKYFAILLNKKYQRANWGLRPLSTEMLDYAREDTHYLFALRDQLDSQLIEQELSDLAREDFETMCRVQAHPGSNNHSECWKVAGASRIDPRQAAILNELCLYRDEQAKKADLPHFKVFSNQLLLDLSQLKPTSTEELQTVPHCTERIIQRHGSGLLTAIARGVEAQPVIRQKTVRPDDAYIARIECLKEWRKKTAKELKVESDVVLPRDLVEQIAGADPAQLSDLQKVMRDAPVRFARFGDQIIRELHTEVKA